ncbi:MULTISPECIES: hypothetical protein [Enterococcus]|uniref:Uncharacterized protein n=1 Tax=Enterococcus sulfureus ATCC 49903 TaxID=1140003 RepID=S0NXY1_9ENTE|nr:hypothetical protein [Enterococcus sulfureus]EOT46478.1 hypothetical protein OMY_01627 [Enterococcus sulfureus ATCC 49903]EOT86209.1 hypothetical protein I573_00962 [Enterococcus sulfureus ATCC 49903]
MNLFFVVLQTILNFIALNVIFQNVANAIVPNSPLGAFIGILYWLVLLLLSYAIAVRFKNKK